MMIAIYCYHKLHGEHRQTVHRSEVLKKKEIDEQRKYVSNPTHTYTDRKTDR